VIGHPFNPPHVIPLVEVVGGEKTSAEAIAQAISFYSSIGKKPIHLRKEVVGHVANRLQAALYREVVHLIEQGVLDVADWRQGSGATYVLTIVVVTDIV
jgi:carnitine 3-dehydrogenase